MINHHPSAFAPYLRNGWKLVPISSGTKGPTSPLWNAIENCINASNDIPEGYGAGLAHAYSGTCSIDIDDMFASSLLFAERGLNLNDYLDAPDAVQIISGRPGSGKLIYKCWLPLASKKINLNGKTALEFRCATTNGLTVQCLLPPSRHPSGTTYQWAGKGDWHNLPQLPPEIMAWWMELISVPEPEPVSKPDTTTYDLEQLRQALEHIDPDCDRKTWLECLMGLKYTNEPDAYLIAKQWSEQGGKYPGDRDFAHQWKSLKNDHPKPITPATLLKHAKDAGYTPPPPDVSALFEDVTPAPIEDMVLMGNPVPDVRLDLMPEILRNYAQEVADTVGASPVIAALSGMVAASAATDARSRLITKLGMSVPPVIWSMGVADPSAKKTQAYEPMMAPFDALAKEDIPRYQAELMAWKFKEAQHLSAMKAYEQHASNPLNDISDAPIVPLLPPQPAPLRFFTSDITSQKLVYMSAERPRGIALITDEGGSFLDQVTSKNSGDKRSTWTASYEARQYHVDRQSTGSFSIENFAVPIYCNIQPKMLQQYMSGKQDAQDDGFLQRFIPAIVPDSQASRVGVGVPEFLSLKHQWEQRIRLIYNETNGGKAYQFDPEAQVEFISYEHWLEAFKADERLIQSNDNMRAAFGKLLGQTGRIAFIWHMLENPDQSHIGVDLVKRAIDWVKAYLIPALRHFYSIGDKVTSFDQWLAEHILTETAEVVSLSDLLRSARRQLDRMNLSGVAAHELIHASCQVLERGQWLAVIPPQPGERLPRWAINPTIKVRFAERRTRIAAIKQERLDEARKIAERVTGKPIARRFAKGYTEAA